MKRKWMVAIIASVVAVGGAIGASAFSDSLTSANKKQEVEIEVDDDAMISLDTKTLLSVEELFEIVLEEVNGTIEEIELEAFADGNVYFEVEVKEKGKEYKVYVDAYSGKVLDVKLDDDDDKEHRTAKSESTKEQSTDKNNVNKNEQPVHNVTVEKKETEKTTTNNNVKKESKDEKTDNKVEQSKQKTETKNESKKHEQKQSEKSKGIISTEEAIQIALSMANGKVTEVELDEDDGRLVYEIEIDLQGDLEAEVEIDAYTGKIIEFELDD